MSRLAGLVAAATVMIGAAPALAAPDPYDALKAMDGRWLATTAGGRVRTVDNHCARTGLFFVCEQAVGGKPAALVVFLPTRHEEGKPVFHTQTLTAAGDRAGPWRELVIDGDKWTYGELDRRRGVKRQERTVVTYAGPDSMHVEIQATADGEAWNTVSSENLNRGP